MIPPAPWPGATCLRTAAEAGFLLAGAALAAADLRTLRLPDRIVLPVLCAGLLLNAAALFVPAAAAALGAAVGYGALWLLDAAHALHAGRRGFGRGDLKLAAMVGGWVGAEGVLAALLLAFLAATCAALPGLLRGRRGLGDSLPFGPALVLGGAAVLLAGPDAVAAALTPG
ncbi:MAG: prepilin peptidase [Janthinobacterium lividum]